MHTTLWTPKMKGMWFLLTENTSRSLHALLNALHKRLPPSATRQNMCTRKNNRPFSKMPAENSNRSILKTCISTRKNTFTLETLPSFSISGVIYITRENVSWNFKKITDVCMTGGPHNRQGQGRRKHKNRNVAIISWCSWRQAAFASLTLSTNWAQALSMKSE